MRSLASRSLALLLLCLVIGIVIFGLIVPAVERITEADAQIAALSEQIEMFEARRGAASEQASIEVAEEVLFQASSPAMSAAMLQDVLKSATERAGAAINSLRVEQAESLDDALKVSVTSDLTATTPALETLLYTLETGVPYVFVERIDVRRAQSTEQIGEPTDLAIRLRVFGYMAAPEAR